MDDAQFSELCEQVMSDANGLLSNRYNEKLGELRGRCQQAAQAIEPTIRQFQLDLQERGLPENRELNESESEILYQGEREWLQRMEALEQQVRPPPLTMDILEQQVNDWYSLIFQRVDNQLKITPLTAEQNQAFQLIQLSLKEKLLVDLVKSQKMLEEEYLYQDFPLLGGEALRNVMQRYTFEVVQSEPLPDEDFTLYSEDRDERVAHAVQNLGAADRWQLNDIERNVKRQLENFLNAGLAQPHLAPGQDFGFNEAQRQQRQSDRRAFASATATSILPQMKGHCKKHQYLTVDTLKDKLAKVEGFTPKQTNELLIGLVENHEKLKLAYERMFKEVPQWATSIVQYLEENAPRPIARPTRHQRNTHSIQIAQGAAQVPLVRSLLTQDIVKAVMDASASKVRQIMPNNHNLTDAEEKLVVKSICGDLLNTSLQPLVKNIKEQAFVLLSSALEIGQQAGAPISAKALSTEILQQIFATEPNFMGNRVEEVLGSDLATSDIKTRIVRKLKGEGPAAKKVKS